jgi:hypothetical protein
VYCDVAGAVGDDEGVVEVVGVCGVDGVVAAVSSAIRACVRGPMVPVGVMLFACWKSLSAASVARPKYVVS